MKTFASSISKVFYGTLIHSRSLKEIEYIKQCLLFIDEQGKIAKLVKDVAHDKVDASLEGVTSEKVKKEPACHHDHPSFPSPKRTHPCSSFTLSFVPYFPSLPLLDLVPVPVPSSLHHHPWCDQSLSLALSSHRVCSDRDEPKNEGSFTPCVAMDPLF